MDEKQFRPFVEKSIDFIIQRILPGSTSTELEREVFERLGIDLNNIHESGAPSVRAGSRRSAADRGGAGCGTILPSRCDCSGEMRNAEGMEISMDP